MGQQQHRQHLGDPDPGPRPHQHLGFHGHRLAVYGGHGPAAALDAETIQPAPQLKMPAADAAMAVWIRVGQHDVVGRLPLVFPQAPETDDGQRRQLHLAPRLLKAHPLGKEAWIAPFQQVGLHRIRDALQRLGRQGAAAELEGRGELLEGVVTDADLPWFGGGGDAGRQVDGVAGDDLVIGEHRAPVDTDAQGQVVLGHLIQVVAGHHLLQLHHGRDRHQRRGVDAERAVAGRVHHPPAEGRHDPIQEIQVALQQATTRRRAEALKVGRGAHHVGEDQGDGAGEARGDGPPKVFLQLDELGKGQVVEGDIRFDTIKDFDGCFLTSTSRDILPVSKIDDLTYQVPNPVIEKLMLVFQDLVFDYLLNFSWD